MDREASAVRPIGDSSGKRSELERHLKLMKAYLSLCVDREDWHGVMDAAADIREIVAKCSMLNH